MKTRLQRIGLGLVALALAAALWLPCVHFIFAHDQESFHREQGVSPQARQLAARHLQVWTDPALKRQELDRMRRSNAEWDFMGRSFLVWSLAEMALREPELKTNYLPVIDEIIDETIRLEREQGIYCFLMPYAKSRPFVAQPARSLFIDGEIALMLSLRRMVEEKDQSAPKIITIPAQRLVGGESEIFKTDFYQLVVTVGAHAANIVAKTEIKAPVLSILIPRALY